MGIMALIFILSLFGCKTVAINQSEPEFKTIQYQYNKDVFYPIKIPAFIPDFTNYKTSLKLLSNCLAIVHNFYIPNRAIDEQGIPDHYRFLVSVFEEVAPGIFAFMSFIGDEARFWIYNEKGEPEETTKQEFISWYEIWEIEAAYRMYQQQFEEKPQTI